MDIKAGKVTVLSIFLIFLYLLTLSSIVFAQEAVQVSFDSLPEKIDGVAKRIVYETQITVLEPNGNVTDESMKARVGNIPSGIPKVFPTVPSQNQLAEDVQGDAVPIYSIPPFLENRPIIQQAVTEGVDSAAKSIDPVKFPSVEIDDEPAEAILTDDSPIPKFVFERDPDYKSEEGGKKFSSEAVILYEGFEGSFPGSSWSVFGDPTWDDDNYKPYAGSWSGWCANGGDSGLDPEYNEYVNDMDAWMFYGPFSLADATSGSLTFQYWGDTELSYDYFSYYVSIDGSHFYGYTTSGNSGGWVQKTIDFTSVYTLGNICGESQVWIAFRFTSNSSVTGQGSFIDEIYVQKEGATTFPNLTLYEPSGWDDEIVVSNQTGTHTEDTIYAGEPAYIDYAYINNGTADITTTFYSKLYINGSLVRTGGKSGLAQNYYGFASDFEYTFPSSGTYTLQLVVDANDDVDESNENDNEYERSKSITTANQTNLAPYQPSGWDEEIVVSNQTGTHTEDTIYAGEPAYIDYAYINNGTADISTTFYSKLYINGSLVRTGGKSGLAQNYYGFASDFEYTFPSSGTYTLQLVVDANDDVDESNENDNEYERSKSITTANQANLTPYQPSGWDDEIVVSNQTGTHAEDTIYAGEPAYIDYAYINNGTADISTTFYSKLYINGSLVRTGGKSGLAQNYYGFASDFEYTFPSSGTYTLQLVVDANDDIDESNENDNEYQKTKNIDTSNNEAIIRISPTSLNIEQPNESFSLGGSYICFDKNSSGAEKKEPQSDVIHSDIDGLSVKLNTHGMFVEEQTEDEELYKLIKLGRYNGDLPPGQPNLPAIRKYVYVPKGKSTHLEVTLGDDSTFDDYLVFPVQLPQMDTKGAKTPPFYRDENIYTADQWFPEKMVHLGPLEVIRGHSVQMLSICPFQYNPAQKKLRIFPEINVDIRFEGTVQKVNENLRSTVFGQFIKGIILNPDCYKEANAGLDDDIDVYTGESYLIITAPEFEAQANALRDHKINLGISTGVVTTAVTGTTTSQIQSYIQNVYDTYSPAPTYLLLLGDVETIPTTYDGTADTGTDLYYSTLDGSDFVPDIFMGRIPVDTATQAQTVVDKIINYENNPPSSASFYANAVVAAYFQDGTPYSGTPDGYEDRRFVKTAEEVRNFLVSNGYNVERIYCAESATTPTNYNNGTYANGEPLPSELLRANGHAWDGNSADITAAINNGAFLVMHRDHGMDRNGGYTNTGWGDPYYTQTHMSALSNGNLLPVVMSMNCQTGWFDGETDHNSAYNYESFCELFLRKEEGGAVGLFGATRSSYSGYNDYMAEGMIDCVWPDFLPTVSNNTGANSRLGAMLNFGKLAMDQLWGDPWDLRQLEYELFHVLGDPSLQMHTSSGEGNTITIYNDGSIDLEIYSMTKRDGDDWLQLSPSAPLTIAPGAFQTVDVIVDWNQGVGGYDDEQVIITSNDEDMSPYPEGIFVNVTTAGNLLVTPSAPLTSTGNEGGSFSPSSKSYVLENTGGSSIDWQVTKGQSWLTVSPSSGTLASNSSETVMVSINSNANNLAPDLYSDTVEFTNTTNGMGDTSRSVSLTVNAVLGTLSVSPSGGLSSSGCEGGPFNPGSIVYTVTNTGAESINYQIAKTEDWVSLSQTLGTLASGASRTVTVLINGNADALPGGSYSDSISFTNMTNGMGNTSRSISLRVRMYSDSKAMPWVRLLLLED